MGAGIAQVAACAGYPVVMIDIEQEYVDKGLATIERSLSRIVSKGRMSEQEAEKAVSLISTSVSRESASDADLVIEAIPEVLKLKVSAFSDLDRYARRPPY